MNRIEELFKAKAADKMLSIYFPAGYPQLNDTLPILEALESRGVDLVEIGIPFSDPIADGVVIQEASTKAINNGISLRKIFEQLTPMRESVNIPVILMGYLNPILYFGFEKFCAECIRVGVDGVIIPDLPFDDYLKNYKPIAEKYGLKMIMLITPETSDERIRLIDENTSGFIYMVSSAATTGAQGSFGEENIAYFKRVAAMNLKNPRMIGFGISNADNFNAANDYSSGAIIGTFFVGLLTRNKTAKDAVDQLIKEIR